MTVPFVESEDGHRWSDGAASGRLGREAPPGASAEMLDMLMTQMRAILGAESRPPRMRLRRGPIQQSANGSVA